MLGVLAVIYALHDVARRHLDTVTMWSLTTGLCVAVLVSFGCGYAVVWINEQYVEMRILAATAVVVCVATTIAACFDRRARQGPEVPNDQDCRGRR